MRRSVLAVLLVALLLSGCVGITRPAQAEIVEVALPSEPVVAGEPAAVLVTLKNPGWRATSGRLSLLLGGQPASTHDYRLDARAEEAFTLALTPSWAGNATVGLRVANGSAIHKAGSIHILRPGSVQLVNALIAPTLIATTTPVMAVDVRNPGETAARARLNVSAAGDIILTQAIDLAPGEARTLVLEVPAGAPGERALVVEIAGARITKHVRVVDAEATLRAAAREVDDALRGRPSAVLGFDGMRGDDAVHVRVGSNGVLMVVAGKDARPAGGTRASSTACVDPLGYALAAIGTLGLSMLVVERCDVAPASLEGFEPRGSFYCAGGVVTFAAQGHVLTRRHAAECLQLRFGGIPLGDLSQVASGALALEDITPVMDSVSGLFATGSGSIRLVAGPEGARLLTVHAEGGSLEGRVVRGSREPIAPPPAQKRLPAQLVFSTTTNASVTTWTLAGGDVGSIATEFELRVEGKDGAASFNLADASMFGGGFTFASRGMEDGTLDAGDGFALEGAPTGQVVWDLWAGAAVSGTVQPIEDAARAAVPGAAAMLLLAALAIAAFVRRAKL